MMRFIVFLVALCSITNFSQASVITTLQGDFGEEHSHAYTDPVGHHLESISVTLDWEAYGWDWGPAYLRLHITSPDGQNFDVGYNTTHAWGSDWGSNSGTGQYYFDMDVSQLGITGTGVWHLHATNLVSGYSSYSMDVVLHDLNMPTPATLALLSVAGFTTRRRRS